MISEIFTKKKIVDFIINEVLGKFVGFIGGMWTTSWFSYHVYEKKGIKNLFGMLPRKKIVVNTTPEWLQWIICAVIGFIMLELINYFFQHKLYLKIFNYGKQLYARYRKPESTEY